MVTPKPMRGRALSIQTNESDQKSGNAAELVKLAVAGDRKAFQELISDHYDFIFRVAFKWCGAREDAEDIAQDVVIKLARIITTYDGRAAFRSWLYRVVINAVRDLQRQRWRQNQRAIELKNTTAQLQPPEQEQVALQNELWRAVLKLPKRQRDAMLLVYAEDKSHAEAADIMECKESTVSFHIYKAKKTLKKLL